MTLFGYRIFLTLSLIMVGAMFGFFYAYIASGINGLSTMPADRAIDAMNAINIAVRNPIFFPLFFLTPFACFIAAGFGWFSSAKPAAVLIATAGVVYLLGGLILTAQINVPMNDALKLVDTATLTPQQAAQVWDDYASDWSFWNAVRTGFTGISLLFVGLAIYRSPKGQP